MLKKRIKVLHLGNNLAPLPQAPVSRTTCPLTGFYKHVSLLFHGHAFASSETSYKSSGGEGSKLTL